MTKIIKAIPLEGKTKCRYCGGYYKRVKTHQNGIKCYQKKIGLKVPIGPVKLFGVGKVYQSELEVYL